MGTHTGNYDLEKVLPRYELKFPLTHSEIFVPNPEYKKFSVKYFKKGRLKRLIKRGFKFIVK
jgi:hypothetical protein